MNNTGGHYPQTTIQQQQELPNASSFIMNQRMPQPSFPSIQQNPFMINKQSFQQQRDLFNTENSGLSSRCSDSTLNQETTHLNSTDNYAFNDNTEMLNNGQESINSASTQSLFSSNLPKQPSNFKNLNKKGCNLKLLHWNKGSSRLENKMDEVKMIIQKYKPHALGLSEANLFFDTDQALVQIEDYELHICDTITNPDLMVSRVVVYTHKSVNTKVRRDLMDDRISTLWLEIGQPGKRKVLLGNAYREWSYLRQNNSHSGSDIAQLRRWKLLIENGN